MKYPIFYLIVASLFFSLEISAQEIPWHFKERTELYEEMHAAIQDESGGFLITGTVLEGNPASGHYASFVRKLGPSGVLKWERLHSMLDGNEFNLEIAVDATELNDHYFVSISQISGANNTGAYVMKLEPNSGDIIDTLYRPWFDITEIHRTSDDHLMTVMIDLNSGDMSLAKFDDLFNLIWEIPLENLEGGIFDTYSHYLSSGTFFIVGFNQQNENEAMLLEYNDDGVQLRNEIFAIDPAQTRNGIMTSFIDESKLAVVANGRKLSGVPIIRILDTENLSEIAEVDLSDDFFWLERIISLNNHLYVFGQDEANHPYLAILNEDYEIVKTMEYGDVFFDETIDDVSFTDAAITQDGNILFSGMIITGFQSAGHIYGVMNTCGGFEFLSSTLEENPDVEIALFPNPSTDFIYVTSERNIISCYEIYDIYGRLVSSIKNDSNSTKIPVNHLHEGTYWLIVKSDLGQQSIKFIKSK